MSTQVRDPWAYRLGVRRHTGKRVGESADFTGHNLYRDAPESLADYVQGGYDALAARGLSVSIFGLIIPATPRPQP